MRAALDRVDGLGEVIVDERVLHARAEDGARTVPAVLTALEGAGAEVGSVTVARPSLDDVYLRFAGRTFGAAEADDRERSTNGKGARAMKALRDTQHMTVRHLMALWRQPWWIAVSLVQPVIWLLLFGALFKSVTDIPGFGSTNYIQFLAPGVVVMTAFFGAGWTGMPVIDDINRGVDRPLPGQRRCGAAR